MSHSGDLDESLSLLYDLPRSVWIVVFVLQGHLPLEKPLKRGEPGECLPVSSPRWGIWGLHFGEQLLIRVILCLGPRIGGDRSGTLVA